MTPPKLIVYRDTLLPKSEIAFMQRQYCGFSELEPVWVGRRVEPWLDRAAFRVGPVFGGLEGVAFKLLGTVPQRARLRDLHAVAVHAQFGRGGALALPLARALGLPLVVTFHGGDVHKSAHYRRLALFRLRMAALMDYTSAFVCVSRGVRDRLIARGFPAAKTVVIPIGTDLPAAAPRDHAGAGLLFAGRFVEMKGLPVLIAAIRLLRSRGVAERFVLIGDGPDRDAVTRAAAGLEGVELRGWQPAEAVRAAMLSARALCLPSVVARSGEAEGLPSVAVEAMGLGVPVIASSAAGVDGLVENGVTGLMFPSGDASALATRIAALLADPALGLALGRAAHARVLADYDARRQSRRLEAVLLDAVRLTRPAADRP